MLFSFSYYDCITRCMPIIFIETYKLLVALLLIVTLYQRTLIYVSFEKYWLFYQTVLLLFYRTEKLHFIVKSLQPNSAFVSRAEVIFLMIFSIILFRIYFALNILHYSQNSSHNSDTISIVACFVIYSIAHNYNVDLFQQMCKFNSVTD